MRKQTKCISNFIASVAYLKVGVAQARVGGEERVWVGGGMIEGRHVVVDREKSINRLVIGGKFGQHVESYLNFALVLINAFVYIPTTMWIMAIYVFALIHC